MQTAAAARLFDETPNSFANSRSQSDQNAHTLRVPLPERESGRGGIFRKFGCASVFLVRQVEPYVGRAGNRESVKCANPGA
jgi:hypothetical protein